MLLFVAICQMKTVKLQVCAQHLVAIDRMSWPHFTRCAKSRKPCEISHSYSRPEKVENLHISTIGVDFKIKRMKAAQKIVKLQVCF